MTKEQVKEFDKQCECDAPLVRADVSGGEYCGDCGFDIKK